MAAGSSPRVRGTLTTGGGHIDVPRIIPARAGNAAACSRSQAPSPDHPRACGERLVVLCLCHASPGSSPRVRGTHDLPVRLGRPQRIIPARAGNAWPREAVAAPGPDHPRACGERMDAVSHFSGSIGSSPRVRGTPCPLRCPRLRSRIIPARAGNAGWLPCPPHVESDHPRACGERDGQLAMALKAPGSSPRVRGTHRNDGVAPLPERIIPARAGNARRFDPYQGNGADHPRACGERAAHAWLVQNEHGSSPRVRGTLRASKLHHDYLRIIPARAGNAGR